MAATEYLSGTLASLSDAGITPTLIHDDALLCGPNASFRACMRSLLAASTAEALCVFQDDVFVARGLGEWIEAMDWPQSPDSIGAMSLYCASPHSHKGRGWWQQPVNGDFEFRGRTHPSWVTVYGALATLWPRQSAEMFVDDPPPFAGASKLDQLIGAWCASRDLSYWVHSPSLVQHTGMVSTNGMVANELIPSRRADSFVEDVSALEAKCELMRSC